METPIAVPENLKSRLRDSYDAIAEKYTDWASRKADIRVDYLEKLLALLPSSHRDMLEIGCGAGIPTTEKLLAHNRSFRITANDLSSAQIALGKTRLQHAAADGVDRVEWVEGDMMKLNSVDDSFDIVLRFYTIQHLPLEEQVVMLGRIVKWLRPGGYMLINSPAEKSENVVMTGWMGSEGWMYHSGWGTEKYRELVKEIGMDLVLDEVREDNVKAEFLWIIAKKLEA